MIKGETTQYLSMEDTGEIGRDSLTDCPLLFVCQGKAISEHRLEGKQVFGRPADDIRPDISVFNRYVSRRHGIFETSAHEVWFTALETTNPTKFKGSQLNPGDRIPLHDGDELVITYETGNGTSSTVILIVASSSSRVSLWRNLQQAARDELTTLYGRDGFSGWWRDNRDGSDYKKAALFILDVDDFKMINDRNGHNAGDMVLKSVADELRKTVRYDNQICRWGGDEFVGVIPGDREHIESRLQDVSRRISAASVISGIPVTVSIGYLYLPEDRRDIDLEALVEKADKAMYSAKRRGKNGICGL